MFQSFGTLLSPLYSFLRFFADNTDEEEADDGDPDSKGDSGEQDNGDDDDNENKDDDEEEEVVDEDDTDFAAGLDDDLDDDLDNEERTRRNADSAISKSNDQVDKTLTTMVRQMVKFPESAESVIEDLRSEQPDLAKRLAKMYENEKSGSLKDALQDAPEGVRDVLSQLVDTVNTMQQKQKENASQEDRKTFIGWVKESHPYLHPKSAERKTKMGGQLFSAFRKAINRMPADEPVTEDMLEDALAIAKRRTGWNNSRVSESVRQQAKEQAKKARSGAVGTGKSRSGEGGKAEAEPSRITRLFGGDAKRQAKVDVIKKKKFKHLDW